MRATRSIFTKLFVTMIVAALAVNFLVGAFFRYFFIPRSRDVLAANIGIYTDYIARDIGVPPDTKRAAAMAGRTGFAISITGGGLSWSSNGAIRFPSHPRVIRRLPDGDIAWERGRFVYRKSFGAYRYLFSPRSAMPAEVEELHVVLLISALTVILGVGFLLIRRIMMPVRRLASGMREVSGGNLEYEVRVDSGDELGDLARTFNGMRERIRAMIRSREQLLLDVSHELRSPLTRIKVALEYVQEGSARQDIADDVIEMERMVTELLETERLNRSGGIAAKEEVDLPVLLREVADEMQIPSGGILYIIRDNAAVRADRRLVRMLFRNLLENARKFSPPDSGPVSVTVRMSGEGAVTEVRDRGIGIPRDELASVFEPFYRVDHSRSKKTGGYGLGLSLCKKIAEAHGGSISIESEPGRGTTVTVVLPL